MKYFTIIEASERSTCHGMAVAQHFDQEEMMSEKDLAKLIEAARAYTPTKNEREQQRRSFAFGNTHFENSTITRETIDRAAEKLQVRERSADAITPQETSIYCKHNRIPKFCGVSQDCKVCDHYHNPFDAKDSEVAALRAENEALKHAFSKCWGRLVSEGYSCPLCGNHDQCAEDCLAKRMGLE